MTGSLADRYPHCWKVTVAFRDVDMLGVCNNAVYLSYFEDARIAFIRDAGLLPPGGLFADGSHFFMVRNEINYFSPSRHGDTLHVYTRIAFIRNSSYGFEHVVVNPDSGLNVAEGSGVVVRVDPGSRKAVLLSDDFIRKVMAFQGEVELLREKQK